MHVRIGRCLAVGTLAFAGLAVAAPAGAVVQGPAPFDVTCKAKIGPTIELDRVQTFSPKVDVPLQVDAGSTVKVKIPGGTTTLPSTQNPDGTGLAITAYENLGTTYKVVGGNLVADSDEADGQATINGDPVTGGTVQFTSDTWKPFTPGPIPPGALVTPAITVDVVAGAAGSEIQIRSTGSTTTATLPALAAVGKAAVTCAYDVLLATIAVVEPLPPPPPPPPPGAPTAANDGPIETPVDTPVTIDVLANDEPNAEFAMDVASLSIKEPPDDGTAEVVDGKIVYTPNAGFTGRDIFQYEICSVDVEEPTTTTTEDIVPEQLLEGACHFAFVTVDVVAPEPPVVEATTVPPTAAPATTVAAAATLPVTGSSTSSTLPLFGALLLIAGAAFVAIVRRQPSPR